MKDYTRREALKMMGTTSAMLPFGLVSAKGKSGDSASKAKILVAGAHPDDPETGCGGTMALLANQGHEVVSLYLTRGEAGIPGKSHDDAASIRTKEAKKACEILEARPRFAGQIDGDTVVNNEWFKKVGAIFDEEQPDVIFTHWPVDSHRDHRAMSLLAYDWWLNNGKKAALYYFEVLSGIQSQVFDPDFYIDISSVEPTKRKACYAHASQHPDEMYGIHEQMASFRGLEHRCDYAEAFVYHDQGPQMKK